MRVIVSPLLLGALISMARPAAAQDIDHRVSLGIEVPVLSIRHMGISQATRTRTGMGLFTSGADLNGQYGLSNSSVLGLRVGVSRETDAWSGTPVGAQSQISLAPRYEYYFKPGRPTRPHVGVEAAFARSTETGYAAYTDWLVGPTGGVSYFANSNWQFDVNASFFLSTGSYGPASTSGQGFILRIDISGWLGGNRDKPEIVPPAQGGLGLSGNSAAPTPAPAATNSSEWKGAAPVPPPNSAPPDATPTNPSTTPAPAPAVATPEPTAAPAEALLTKEGRRVTLDLHEGRRLTLVAAGGTEKKVKFILVKAPADASLKWCSAVDLHAPNQSEIKIDVRYKLLTTPSGDVATLSAELPTEVLKPLIEAPLSKQPQPTPDHWLGVCGQNWPLSTLERRQLKDFLNKS